MAVKEGSLVVGHMPRKTSAVSCHLLFLGTVTITATVRNSRQCSNDLLLGGLKDHLLHFFVYDCSLAEAGAVVTNSTLMEGNFCYIISL